MRTPVAFFIFNRPETTARVFDEIAKARPPLLFVVADGPRDTRPGEREACLAARAVVGRVDWPCEVVTDFAEANMGCGARVAGGLERVFGQVEEAIVLEDDCLPHPSFFPFCEELLKRYRDDERVMAICGANFQWGRTRTPFSYYFSRYVHPWGWATWRRAWRHYDFRVSRWPALRGTGWLLDTLGDRAAARYWRSLFDEVAAGCIDTWDYQWVFACWVRDALAAAPDVNLISNIGFGTDSTHTAHADSPLADLPTREMEFPLRHPPDVRRQREADEYTFERALLWHGYEPTLYDRFHRLVSKALPAPAREVLSALRSKLK